MGGSGKIDKYRSANTVQSMLITELLSGRRWRGMVVEATVLTPVAQCGEAKLLHQRSTKNV